MELSRLQHGLGLRGTDPCSHDDLGNIPQFRTSFTASVHRLLTPRSKYYIPGTGLDLYTVQGERGLSSPAVGLERKVQLVPGDDVFQTRRWSSRPGVEVVPASSIRRSQGQAEEKRLFIYIK